MEQYRAFIVDAEGHILKRHDFDAADDAAALASAGRYVDGHDVEVWQLDRIVGKLARKAQP